MIGDNTGNVYRGQQGTGFATTFKANDALERSLLASKPKSKADFAKTTEENRPGDTWHYYNNELAKAVDGKINEGASIMTLTGSSNLWADVSDKALKWRSDMASLNRAKTNIDQYQKSYNEAVGAIAVREDQYDPEYVQAVKDFPAQHSFAQLADGKIGFPVPKFTNPGDLYADFYTKDADDYQKSLKEGQLPDKNAIKDRMVTYFSDPSKKVNAQAAQQAYGNLTDEAKKRYQAIAEIEGFDQPWLAHAFSNYTNRLTVKDVDIVGAAAKYGRDAATADYEKIKESGDLTTMTASTSLADKSYPEKQAKSYFYENAHLLDNPGAMQQLGVSMEIPREERRKAAEKAFAKTIRDNVQRAYKKSETTDEGGSGKSPEEIKANWDLWRQRIGSKDQTIANEAAGFIIGAKGPTGAGTVTDAWVDLYAPGSVPFKVRGGGTVMRGEVPQKLVIKYDNVSAARAARDKYYKEAMIGFTKEENETQQEFDERKNAYEMYLKDLTQDAGLTVEIPLIGDKEQILKRFHDEAVTRAKDLYQPEIKRQEDRLGIIKQGSASDPANLDN